MGNRVPFSLQIFTFTFKIFKGNIKHTDNCSKVINFENSINAVIK